MFRVSTLKRPQFSIFVIIVQTGLERPSLTKKMWFISTEPIKLTPNFQYDAKNKNDWLFIE